MTSWSNEELRKLTNLANHKISADIAGEYVWSHNLSGKWEIHSIQVFTEMNKAYSWLYFWLDNWGKELREREIKKAKADRRRLKVIKKSTKMTNKEKVLELRTLMTSYTLQDIANEIGVSLSTVKRSLK
tara:strand:- start:205 stop:591 length:387 start_codon:yes stop_codon:yes gene_type:complete